MQRYTFLHELNGEHHTFLHELKGERYTFLHEHKGEHHDKTERPRLCGEQEFAVP